MLFAQSARIFEENLAEPEQAVEQLRKLLEETPGDAEALSRWIASSPARGGTRISSRCWTSGPGSRRTPEERDELAFRAARITETELSDVEAAISRYQGILAATPDHPGDARGAGRRSRAATTTACRPSRCWSRSCATRGPGREVIELLELRLAVEDAVDRRLALLGEIARIQEMERRDIEGAFATWARALTEEATEAAPRQALERLAAATGAWKRLAEVYEERMEATFDASLQRSLALRLAVAVREGAGRSRARRRFPAQGAVAARATRRRCWRRWR